MIYLGDAVSQLDGTAYAHQNCVAACTSVLGDTSSLSWWNVPPSRIRKLSGDTVGGLTYGDSVAALKLATGGEVDLKVLYWAPQNATTSTLDDLIDAGKVMAISILAAITRYTPYNTGTFTGRHNVVVGAKRYATLTRSDGTKFTQKQGLVMDPGHTDVKWVWWPWNLIVKAATSSTGTNAIHCYYTRDLTNVKRRAKTSGAVRSTPAVTATNVVGRVVKDAEYTVLDTVKGGTWNLDVRKGTGWSKIGDKKFTHAGRIR